MRLLPILALAALPCAGFAQDAAAVIEKADATVTDTTIAPADLGVPSDPDAAKTADLSAAKAAEAQLSDFDTDKVAGNDPVAAPLGQRLKAPGMLPDPPPAVADLGTGTEDEKTVVIEVAKATENRPTTYDEDKIDGNEPLALPLVDRQKAQSFSVADTGDTDLGVPASPPDPKVAEVAVSFAESVPSIYDDDKIAGNDAGDSYVSGPLAERQKFPSELAEGADPTTFGQPAEDAVKEAVVEVSKAEIGGLSVEDNDKIAGNPVVAPPLTPRSKAPSVLPNPVADADMGQPAGDAPKVDLAVSKDAEDRPNTEDNDKIDGNPVVNPPLTERVKGPAYEPAVAGLNDEALGLPLAPEALKTADVGVSKLAEAVATEYDEDKIAGNSYQDPSLDPEFYDSYDPLPPQELVDQVRSILDDPATRTATLEGVAARALAPQPVAASFQSFLGILYDAPEVRDLMAIEMARVFMDVGLTPENPAAVGRMAAEYLAGFGESDAWQGTARRSVEEQRAYLTDLLRVAETLPPAQCATYLDGTMDGGQQRRILLTAIADWTEEERNMVFIHRAAAILAAVQDNPPFVPMPDQDAQAARASLGEAALAAIDATENGADLLAAFGDPLSATPEQNCAVQKLILGAALAKTGADGDLAVRYLVENGWAS
jgi:hypothetical protein